MRATWRSWRGHCTSFSWTIRVKLLIVVGMSFYILAKGSIDPLFSSVESRLT